MVLRNPKPPEDVARERLKLLSLASDPRRCKMGLAVLEMAFPADADASVEFVGFLPGAAVWGLKLVFDIEDGRSGGALTRRDARLSAVSSAAVVPRIDFRM
jgi:hypothetical protein